MASPSGPIIHRLRYETASSYESPTRIDGFFSDFEMFADALNHRFEPKRAMAVAKNDLTLNSKAARNQSTVVATRFSITNIALETCRFFASHHYGPADPQVGNRNRVAVRSIAAVLAKSTGFISAIANFTASGNAEEAQRVKNTIHETMLNELWQA